MLEDAEERADIAENSLAKMRAKSRSGVGFGSNARMARSVGSAAKAAFKFLVFVSFRSARFSETYFVSTFSFF